MFTQNLMKGTSTCFFRSTEKEFLVDLNGKTSEVEVFKKLKEAGIECVELSFNYDRYINFMDFPNNAEKYAEYAKEAGITLFSIHLPFSMKHDISDTIEENRNAIIAANEALIRAAGRIGIKVAVLHPSSEPIWNCERGERMRRSREAITYLKKVSDESGITLAVENLPRTCLCNTSSEMVELLEGTGVSVIFDTNHSLIETNEVFIRNLTKAGLRIVSLHISDYDFTDEKHRLPGDGINDWKAIFSALEENGYEGPLMYEVIKVPKGREQVPFCDLAENMKKLANGKI